MQRLIIGFLFLLAAIAGIAQSNPVQWSFSSRKTADKTYEVVATAIVQSPWHIYSQSTPDGGPLPTKIVYNKNPLITLDGETKESGKIITKFEEVFDLNVKYFDGKVEFIQTIKLKAAAKTNVSGVVEFMVCNDTQCLPPTKVPFTVSL